MTFDFRCDSDHLISKPVYQYFKQLFKCSEEYMMTYLEDCRCSLSNNLNEQEMKSYVIGRKGWLFCDTPAEADASKAHDLNVFQYIRYILEQRPSKEMKEASGIITME